MREHEIGSNILADEAEGDHGRHQRDAARHTVTFEMRAILKSKQAFRHRLAARPVAEKLRLLDELRERTLTIIASRKSQPQRPR